MIIEDGEGDELEVDEGFSEWNGKLLFDVYNDIKGCSCYVDLTVNQVKDLVSHLQQTLDEHGDKTQ